MTFNVEVKTEGEKLERGDLFYDKRKLYVVERVGKPRGRVGIFHVKMRMLGKINLDRQRRTDMALPPMRPVVVGQPHITPSFRGRMDRMDDGDKYR